MTFKKF